MKHNKTYYNPQLSEHFLLKEYLEGKSMPKKAIGLSYRDYNIEADNYIRKNISLIESIREWANYEFLFEVNEEIPVIILSGFRSVEWEKLRGRSGNSQHTIGAVDLRFDVSDELNSKIIRAMYDKLHNDRYMGGLAINKSNNLYSFLHIDFRLPSAQHKARGYGARWMY